MKIPKIIDAMANVDDRYILEAAECGTEKKRSGITIMKKMAAIAACAVFVIGAAAVYFRPQSDLPVEPSDDDVSVTDNSVTSPTDVDNPTVSDETNGEVEVERSYNERIADGEDVDVETYIGQEFNACGYTFVLRNVNISLTLPDGITIDDMRDGTIAPIGDYDEDGYLVLHPGEDIYKSYDIRDYLDEDGRYNGPTKEGYRWVFVTVDVTNNSDEEITEYSNVFICGGDFITSRTYTIIDAFGVEHTETQEVAYYQYSQSACYMSEHTDKENYGGQAEVKKFDNIHFEPNETKTLVLGYAITDHFVYDDLYLQILFLNGASWTEGRQYIPLK